MAPPPVTLLARTTVVRPTRVSEEANRLGCDRVDGLPLLEVPVAQPAAKRGVSQIRPVPRLHQPTGARFK
jgi:hypothetical protein